jgi:hypothetical protein
MESDTTTAVLTSPGKGENPMAEGFTGFVSLAMLEFQATLQLLVERARFLTAASSVAVAVKEDGNFVYAAGTGDSAPEAGVAVDTAPPSIQRCLKHQLPVQTEASPAQPSASLIVPILKDGKLCGFFELLGRSRFEQCDLEAVARLAEMVNTAIEHRSAAVRVESREFRQVSEVSRAPVPKLWHAPESAEPKPRGESSTATNLPAVDVQNCASCGFPVSTGRQLCLDCEQKDAAHIPADPLSTPVHESWISAHGYTIASLLISALAIAIILWFR